MKEFNKCMLLGRIEQINSTQKLLEKEKKRIVNIYNKRHRKGKKEIASSEGSLHSWRHGKTKTYTLGGDAG